MRGARRRAKPGDPLLGVAYLRVSTSRQELGPEAQRQAIKAFAARHSIRIIATRDERNVSGAKPVGERPGFQAALEDLRSSGAGTLLIHRRDRLARDTFEAIVAERLVERNGARIVDVAGPGNGDSDDDKLIRRVLDAIAERERAAIGARVRAALHVKMQRGECVGWPPWGWRLSADRIHLEPEPREILIFRRAMKLRAKGLSYREISRLLAKAGLLNRVGKPFLVSSLSLLTRGKVSGARRLLESDPARPKAARRRC